MTVTKHKILVAQGCFKVGLYWQGIIHDLSKYEPSEFMVGAKYYQGTRSPNNAEREEIGFSSAWLHHKGRNKHHYEYWIDYSSHTIPGGMMPVPMPDRYIAEMIMDRIAASKVYKGKDYTDECPLAYYWQGTDHAPLHPYTRKKLLRYLKMLAKYGETYSFARMKSELVKHEGRTERKRPKC
ncbi:MAG: catalase [Lachnospiraceae bacterium]|nr:catalase [Lachnospiraceae bacterium]